MKKESAFIKECFSAYLGNPDYKKLHHLFCSINENKLNVLIQKHQLGGLFYYLYKLDHFKEIPFSSTLIDIWKKTSWSNTFKNSFNDIECIEILKSFDNANIDYAYIKGAVCRKYYENDYIRSSVDIDIFINRNEYVTAKNILLENDYTIPVSQYKTSGVEMDFSEYEEFAKEIAFTKEVKHTNFIMDLQWDFIGFERDALFNKLYSINSIILNYNTATIALNEYQAKSLTSEKELYIMAFHYAFHHSFRGLKWLLDICTYVKNSGMNYEEMTFGLSESGKKIIGLVTMLSNEFSCNGTLSKDERSILHVDKLSWFEYRLYKSMLFKTHKGVSASISSRLIIAMLPYKTKDKLRTFKYLLFNSASLQHRIAPDKRKRGLLTPFSLLKIVILDFFRHRKSSNEKTD